MRKLLPATALPAALLGTLLATMPPALPAAAQVASQGGASQGSTSQGGAPEAPGVLTPAQRAEVVAVLRQALRDDPSILRDALAAMEVAAQRDREQASRAAIAANRDALLRDPESPVRGNPQGSVTVVEFFDARCGYCKSMQPAMDQLLRSNRNVRLVMKDLPILGPNSVLASRALLAAQRQGKYDALYDALLRLRTDPNEAVLRAEAERVGLDWARLRRDMDDPAIARRIENNLRLARNLGIEGTPALVIGDRLIPGAVDLATLEAAVAEASR
ncbi:DsbA family protein [Roseomonas sp. NAR14]|uniref:DsbA family protein n=1 Tax=Roseomonas acroporae TaxID=2937791 RepID=A0A9X1Y6P3_9PROT|nr:DsbA family protein [Roseomonas acroporae]MCK8783077.1 DsbA family protein [Roseomonas acroporae]